MSNAFNKHESKYFNTACLMDEALLYLLQNKEYDFITVKEICAKAGVNRSTFYLHYETMDDLLQETLEYTTKKFEEKFTTDAGDRKLDPMTDLMLITPKYIMPYLEFLKENKKVYIAAMSQSRVFKTDKYFQKTYSQIILPILQKLNVPSDEQKYVAAFYISGLHNLVFAWVKGGCKEDKEFICDLMIRFIPK